LAEDHAVSRSLVFSPEAVTDVEDALTFVRERHPIAASRLRERLERALDDLAGGRFHGREVRVSDGATVQRWVCAPFVIYYRRDDTTLAIGRILHSSRKPIET
jgi:plasmid stabilization system protein ParE